MASTPQEAYGDYLDRLKDQVFDDFTYCKDCDYCEATKDGYGTGDSPTLYECIGEPADCVGVEHQTE